MEHPIHILVTRWIFYCNNVRFESFVSRGIPYVNVAIGGICSIGKGFKINNIRSSNPIGRIERCSIVVSKGALLEIGENVGMSFTAINCQQSIVIGDNVVIGGGCCIYDSDFHPLSKYLRSSIDSTSVKRSPVRIEDHAFIGTNCTILKGVTVGQNSIVGACSVVTKSIPPNEIWAGNPAKFISMVPTMKNQQISA